MFALGDIVELIDGDLKGRVVAVKGDVLHIVDDDDFSHDVFTKDVIICRDLKIITPDMHRIICEKESYKVETKQNNNHPKRDILEVDLHIDELVESTRHMTNYEMLTAQLQTAKDKIRYAIHHRISKVVFIHGVGEGVLKSALQDYFRKQDYLDYYDASFIDYGRGATEVLILFSKVG